MAVIDIRRAHKRSVKSAKAAVEHVADDIAQEYGIAHHWDGDKLMFAPCRDRSFVFFEDVSADGQVGKALDLIGLAAGKKLYVELLGFVEHDHDEGLHILGDGGGAWPAFLQVAARAVAVAAQGRIALDQRHQRIGLPLPR